MATTTCPHCGKKGITKRHINLCTKKPATAVKADTTPLKAKKPIMEDARTGVVMDKPDELDGVTKQICPRCGAVAVKLNPRTWRCPVDGDYEERTW